MLLPFRANQEYGALLMTHTLSGSARSSILRGRGGIAPDDAARRGAPRARCSRSTALPNSKQRLESAPKPDLARGKCGSCWVSA